MLKILYQDQHYLAVHKPPKLIVHRSRISEDTDSVVMQLRRQLGEGWSPVHRLDRGTAGVLVFARHPEAARALVALFENREVEKTYLAVVRGHLLQPERIDYPVRLLNGERKDAITDYRPLAQVEIPIAVGRYPQSRYSLVEVKPQTGRFRQIRQHFSHLRHPIIGDKKHGDIHHNKMFAEQLGCDILLLLARELKFRHPFSGDELCIRTTPEPPMLAVVRRFGWEDAVPGD